MINGDRRSGIDTRSEAEKQLMGERRSGIDRRTVDRPAPTTPSNEQLALFARRLRRIMRDEKSRGHFGIANAEQDFSFFPDVIQVVAWIERLSAVESQPQARPALRKAIPGAAATAVGEAGEPQAAAPHREGQ
jgi:cell pole-organizing protein PopZ